MKTKGAGWGELERFLRTTGGTGLFRIHLEDGGREDVYQFVTMNWNVVAATKDGEYQPRFVAEEVLKRYLAGEGVVEWVPLPPYYPPLHLYFFIPLKEEASKGIEKEGR